ncbi:MAG: sulfite exporter TauE/SafE family protein [Chloroflexi bacterium]|nr:sulfite exporter TauE/SafE family protein [Chloroflexota bacterium]
MELIVPLMIFLGVFTQTLTGFGSALATMAVLPAVLGIRTASPLVALMAVTLEVILLIRYRGAINLGAVWRLSLAAIVAIPIGLVAVRSIPEAVVLSILGLVLVAYSIYALITPKLPELKRPAWAFGFGFVGGLLSGAYNVAGPAAVIYGNCRGWRPDEFKSNLQAFFVINDLTVLISHTLAGNLTPVVWSNYLIALPAIGLGIFIGLKIDRRLNPVTFRQIVLWLLIVMGARLIVSSIF